MFSYQCGGMTWNGNATIGFNAGGTWFENHPLSRTSNANSVACLNNSRTVWTNLVYKLTPRGMFRLCTYHHYPLDGQGWGLIGDLAAFDLGPNGGAFEFGC